MNRLKKTRRRSFSFERLESRRPLAGNVLVNFSSGSGWLELIGDNLANAVDVRGTGIPGQALSSPSDIAAQAPAIKSIPFEEKISF